MCECGTVGIDGGPHIHGDEEYGYTRIINAKTIETRDIEFEGSLTSFKSALFEDWNRRLNKYGRIRE
jgi:hypothetical protein